MTCSELVVAEGLVRRYGVQKTLFGGSLGFPAVNGVSLVIRQNEILGLVGESGSGKSTTGRLLLGMEPADEGVVKFAGETVTARANAAWRRQRARMQMVFQDPLSALDRRLSIHDQIEEPLIIHDIGSRAERTERVDELLDAVGLRRMHGERYPHELSGGQRQRAVLARALATKPDFIVCDEPISALDVSIQAQIMNLFEDIQNSLGVAMLFISHDLRAIRQLSSRVAVLYLGSIVEEGSTEDVLKYPLHPYTKALISAVPGHSGLSGDRIVLRGDPPSPANRPSGCSFHPRCPYAVELCRRANPDLSAVDGSGRRVSCHLVSNDINIGAQPGVVG